jgi:non-ribosomal peptide synthetase-like protein
MKLRFARAFAEIFRVTLPPAGFMLVTSLVVIAWTEGEARFGLATTLFALPIVYMVCVGCIALAGALAKWMLIGKYKPFERPLWSNFIWRLEFVNALFEFLTAPIALDALQGTPFLAWYFRLMGARVGRCLYAESMGVLEFDLTSVGDFVALNEVAVMQTHLFEDRVLKASHVRVSDRCNIGNAGVVLYDSVMQEGSTLEALSLLMKGEVLTKGAHFVGLPARSVAQSRKPTRDVVEPTVPLEQSAR